MKVDVTTPEDSEQEPKKEAQSAVDPSVDADAAIVDEAEKIVSDIEEALDAEYEPIETKRSKKKQQDDVFSLADIEKAQEEAKEANDRYLRLQAEWDNYRKRTAREREEERIRASENLVEKLLPVVDDIERALDHAAKGEPQGEFAQFVDGVKAMHNKFLEVLTKAGAEVIDPVGKEFDMNEHQAVAHIEDPTLPESTVRDVYQKGYRMGGHVIRPAMVTVSKGGPSRQENGEDAAQDKAANE
ncbi:MAG: nucleotide exchange factor GrpE [Coriobacteriales bacterium]|nr:nucleotide exchange factor GrpE [Coriobacteriales bacterium]